MTVDGPKAVLHDTTSKAGSDRYHEEINSSGREWRDSQDPRDVEWILMCTVMSLRAEAHRGTCWWMSCRPVADGTSAAELAPPS